MPCGQLGSMACEPMLLMMAQWDPASRCLHQGPCAASCTSLLASANRLKVVCLLLDLSNAPTPSPDRAAPPQAFPQPAPSLQRTQTSSKAAGKWRRCSAAPTGPDLGAPLHKQHPPAAHGSPHRLDPPLHHGGRCAAGAKGLGGQLGGSSHLPPLPLVPARSVPPAVHARVPCPCCRARAPSRRVALHTVCLPPRRRRCRLAQPRAIPSACRCGTTQPLSIQRWLVPPAHVPHPHL